MAVATRPAHPASRLCHDRGNRPREVAGAHPAATSSGNSKTRPPKIAGRYQRSAGKAIVTGPDAAVSGSNQPCCQPFTTTEVSSWSALSRATQPALVLSGSTSSCPGRAGTGGPGTAVSWSRSTLNAAPGTTDRSAEPAASGRSPGPSGHSVAAIGSAARNAATLAVIENRIERPATVSRGPSAQSTVTVRTGSAGTPTGAPAGPSTRTSAIPGASGWAKPSAVRSSTPVHDCRLSSIRSVTRGCTVIGSLPVSCRTCGPSPRLTDTAVGGAGNMPRLPVIANPVTGVGAGSSRVSVGLPPPGSVTVSAGAVQLVRGSPSTAAAAEPRGSATWPGARAIT